MCCALQVDDLRSSLAPAALQYPIVISLAFACYTDVVCVPIVAKLLARLSNDAFLDVVSFPKFVLLLAWIAHRYVRTR